MDDQPVNEARTSRLAIAAFIFIVISFCAGIVLLVLIEGRREAPEPALKAIFFLLLLIQPGAFVLSVILAIWARVRIFRSKGRLKGAWLAVLTLVLELPCFALLAIVFTPPGLIDARRKGNEAAARGALRNISTAQLVYQQSDPDGNKHPDYAPNLGALSAHELIDPVLGGGTKQGYIFSITRSGDDPENRWSATARPLAPGDSGIRYFHVDETGIIRFETSRMAGPKSPAVGK
jgi:hypothetical protein